MGKKEISPRFPMVEGIGVSEKTLFELRAALIKLGYSFFARTSPLSIAQLKSMNKKDFDFMNSSETMRAIVPPSMEIAVNPHKLKLSNSRRSLEEGWGESLAADEYLALEALSLEEKDLKSFLPDGLKDFVSMPVLSASTLVQIDKAYRKESGGFFFDEWYGQSNSQTEYGVAVSVGREWGYGKHSGNGLRIGDWDIYDQPIFMVPAVVLPRKI